MITCTVHERIDDDKDIDARADAVRFVKEGVAWWALVFPALWLLYHRMWLGLLGYLAVVLAIAAASGALGIPEQVSGLFTMSVSVLLALEGNDLRRWTLERKGYRLIDVVTGRDMEECARRFFDEWLPVQARQSLGPADLAKSSAPPARGPAGGDDVIGLFPEPGR